jgi:hypothetical protein
MLSIVFRASTTLVPPPDCSISACPSEKVLPSEALCFPISDVAGQIVQDETVSRLSTTTPFVMVVLSTNSGLLTAQPEKKIMSGKYFMSIKWKYVAVGCVHSHIANVWHSVDVERWILD